MLIVCVLSYFVKKIYLKCRNHEFSQFFFFFKFFSCQDTIDKHVSLVSLHLISFIFNVKLIVCVLSYFVKKIYLKCRNHERSLLPI